MKKFVVDFIKRGIMFSVLGPVIMAAIYIVLEGHDVVHSVTVHELAQGIFSSAVMAFIAAGISVIYNVEKIGLGQASLIQAAVLYFDYLLVYLMNGWIPGNGKSILIYTIIFVFVFMIIWVMIYLLIRASIKKMNEKIKV